MKKAGGLAERKAGGMAARLVGQSVEEMVGVKGEAMELTTTIDSAKEIEAAKKSTSVKVKRKDEL